MPLKPIPPRAGKTPYWSAEGRTSVDTLTEALRLANEGSRRRSSEVGAGIEAGIFAEPGEPTFATAAIGYMKAGGERRFLGPLLKHFGETPLKRIGQADLDEAAAIYPKATPATINRHLYTPAIAVLRRGGVTLLFAGRKAPPANN